MTVSSPPDQLPPPDLTEPAPKPPSRAADLSLTVIGSVLAVLMAILTAVLELQLSALRLGGVFIGVSVIVAVVANYGIAWFAHRATARKWAVVPPALIWLGIMMIAAGRTSEGDVLLAGNNWVGLVTIAAGSLTFGVVGFRLILSPSK
jgi:hypothetical protein